MQHGAVMAKNVRRTGIPATIKGKPNPEYPLDRHLPKGSQADMNALHPDLIDALARVAVSKCAPATKPRPPEPSDGPTSARLDRAAGHVSIGDDKRGNRVYHFHDSPLDRMYSRLTRQAGSASAEAGLRREYIALIKYHHHWRAAGLQDSIGSADLNRVFASDPGSMSGMAKTEHQAHHRRQYREARDGREENGKRVGGLGHKPGIVVDNVVCAGTSLEVAGWAIGSFTSRTSARDGAERILRESGQKLAKLWGIS